jgi:hypothetical protein
MRLPRGLYDFLDHVTTTLMRSMSGGVMLAVEQLLVVSSVGPTHVTVTE